MYIYNHIYIYRDYSHLLTDPQFSDVPKVFHGCPVKLADFG